MKKNYIIVFLLLFAIHAKAQVSGCTDPLANNYDPSATVNNGSCTYSSASVSPVSAVALNGTLNETSGLIKWNGYLYTHNDNSDTNLYALDTLSGAIVQTYPLPGVSNQDWEELSQDENYIYIGDFGNNSNGNRTNLRIIRVEKNSLLSGQPSTTNISFSYSNQTVFTPAGNNNTDFDCEAFIVSQDSIYLFTKQWVSKKTGIYSLPKTPGTYVAALQSTLNVGGLVTGATYLEDRKLVVLVGYSSLLQPFFYLLYDFNKHGFLLGNKRKISVSPGFYQMEGIATSNGLDYYVSNEYFSQPPFVNNPQKLHRYDLGSYLQDYLERQQETLGTDGAQVGNKIRIYPNPAGDTLFIESDISLAGIPYTIVDMNGKTVLSGVLESDKNKLDISSLIDGLYAVTIKDMINYTFKLIKKT